MKLEKSTYSSAKTVKSFVVYNMKLLICVFQIFRALLVRFH